MHMREIISPKCVCVCVCEAINCNYQNNRKTAGKKVQSSIVEEEGKRLFVSSSYRDPQMDHYLFHIVYYDWPVSPFTER